MMANVEGGHEIINGRGGFSNLRQEDAGKKTCLPKREEEPRAADYGGSEEQKGRCTLGMLKQFVEGV